MVTPSDAVYGCRWEYSVHTHPTSQTRISITDWLNAIGQDGWELCHVERYEFRRQTDSGVDVTHSVWFKRRVIAGVKEEQNE